MSPLFLSPWAFKVQKTWSQVTWLLALQTPILIGCKFLMILACHLAAFATRLQTVRCDQLSLKLYTAFKAVVKFSFLTFFFALFSRDNKQKNKFWTWNKTPSWIFQLGECRYKSLTMTYFHTGIRTIIGAESFHCPVRDGKEWYQLAMVIRHNCFDGLP